jgi:hypothetical protein
MMEKPYLGMLGYTAEGRPFMTMDVDEAKDIGKALELSEYILVPRGDKRRTHLGYISDEEGTATRRPPASPYSATCCPRASARCRVGRTKAWTEACLSDLLLDQVLRSWTSALMNSQNFVKLWLDEVRVQDPSPLRSR